MYKALLFDLDDTIFDFNKNEKLSLDNTFIKFNIPLKYINLYQEINNSLWKQFEQGSIKIEDIYNQRFPLLTKKLGIHHSKDIETYYQQQLSNQVEYIEGALETLNKLVSKYSLYVITNGIAFVQRGRLTKSNLVKLFEDIFISEEIKANKPHKKFFDYVLHQIPYINKECLIIGDSLTSDIQGGINSSIDTCWLNMTNLNCDGIQPTYQINNIKELLTYL